MAKQPFRREVDAAPPEPIEEATVEIAEPTAVETPDAVSVPTEPDGTPIVEPVNEVSGRLLIVSLPYRHGKLLIDRGTYDSADPALRGLADYLVSAGHARWVD